MKTKPDLTIPLVFILAGILLSLPVLIHSNILAKSGYIYLSFCLALALFGMWHIKAYKIGKEDLSAYFFLGLIKRKYKISTLNKYKMQATEPGPGAYTSLYSFIYLFSRQEKFNKYRRLKLFFKNGSTLTLDERFVKTTQEFNQLYRLIKHNSKKKASEN